MLRSRFEDRFFDACDELIRQGELRASGGGSQRFGFSIVSLDFMIMESLQGFQEGVLDHTRKSECLISRFLKSWPTFNDALPTHKLDANHWAKILYKDCRCALHHTASTSGNVIIGISGKALLFSSDNSVKINRTEFHRSLKKKFESYLEQLKLVGNKELRQNFKSKMDAICGT